MQHIARWLFLAVLAFLVVAIVIGLLPDNRDSEFWADRADRAFAKELSVVR